MANALYPKLALTNLGKNKSTYFPYMLTSIVCIMTYYIMQSIAMNEGLMEVPGAAIAMTIFFLGTGIIAVFCIALMFYTNSFLIKRRKKELGLYCVLGMEKRHVALVLFFETLFTAIACLALGLLFGVLFSKLLFMALLYLLDLARHCCTTWCTSALPTRWSCSTAGRKAKKSQKPPGFSPLRAWPRWQAAILSPYISKAR